MKKVVVLSLGGSLIIPDNIDIKFLREFKKTILRNTKKYKFVIVCGGGSVARKYISVLAQEKINEKLQSFSGISATRMNARFMSYFSNINPEYGIPHTLNTLKKYLGSHDIVFCGALEYKPEQTSDSTSAELAKIFRTIFINLTDIAGLYDKNPKENKTNSSKDFRGKTPRRKRGRVKENKNAKFISKIGWKDFNEMANKNKYKPGQHFVLDQTASKIIRNFRIPTYIIGKDMKNLDYILKGKRFNGTFIDG